MKAIPENTVQWLNNQISQAVVNKAERLRKAVEKKYEFSEGATVRLQAQLDETYKKQNSIFVLKPVLEGEGESLHTRNSVIIAGAMMDYSSQRAAVSLTMAAHNAGITVYQYDISHASPPVSSFFSDLCKRNNTYSKINRSAGIFRPVFNGIDSLTNSIAGGYVQRAAAANLVSLFSNIPKSMPVIAVDSWTAHAAVLAGIERVINCIPDSKPHFSSLCESAVNVVQTHESWFQSSTLNALVQGKKDIVVPDKSNFLHSSGHFIEIETVKSIDRDCKKRVSRSKRGEPLRVLISIPSENCNTEMYRQVIRKLVPLVAPQKIALFINLGNNKNAWENIKSSFSTTQSLVTTYFNKGDSFSFAHSASSVSVQGIHVFLNEDKYAGVCLSNILVRATDILITEPDSLSFFPVPKIFLRAESEIAKSNAEYSMHVGDGMTAHSFSALSRLLQLLISDPSLIEHYCNAIVSNEKAGLYDGAYHVLESALRKKIGRVMYPE